jgi:hypothetical protein
MPRNLFANLFRPDAPATLPAACRGVRSRLSAYLDRELTAEERTLVDAHLEQCAGCRAELSAWRSAVSALGGARAAIPSPGDLRGEFYARLEQSRRRPSRAGWLLAAPALAGIAALWLLAGRLHPVGAGGEPHGAPLAAIGPSDTSGPNRQPAARTDTERSERDRALAVAGGARTPAGIAPRPVRVPRSRQTMLALLDRESRTPRRTRRAMRAVAPATWRLTFGRPKGTGNQLALAETRVDRSPEAPASGMPGVLEQRDRTDRYADATAEQPQQGRVVLANLETELHVSDES